MANLITSKKHALATCQQEVADLIDTGRQFHQMKWSLATSSNYSIVVSRDPFKLLMTASGKDKGRLQPHDFIIVDGFGESLHDAEMGERSSAETQLHLMAVETFGAGCVLHTHSIYATTLSEQFAERGKIEFSGFEMQKAIEGFTSHDTTLTLPIFDNNQDITALRKSVELSLNADSTSHGFLIRKHGLYVWGKDLPSARRHIEAYEFLLEATASIQ